MNIVPDAIGGNERPPTNFSPPFDRSWIEGTAIAKGGAGEGYAVQREECIVF